MRTVAAVKLYELGRLSSGRAAELAGLPRVEFLLALGRYKVCPFEAELRDLENRSESSGISGARSIDELADFWDTHDAVDYDDQTHEATIEFDVQNEGPEA
jgi:hypothetical protein